MSNIDNPFNRGYQNLHIVRTLLITYEDDCPPVWRPLHQSQAHLADDLIALSPCVIGPDFALVTEGQEIPDDLESQCPTQGIARAVIYAIAADDLEGRPMHVGDTYSEQAAHEVLQRLRFETGFYSRAWEISSAHLTQEASDYLMNLADLATPTAFLFIAFRIPYSPAIGLKLIATPWTDEHLQYVESITAEQLRQSFRDKGMPDSLANAVYLAGLADVRILIFDADAAVLDGLPLYDDLA
ncbi:DUF5983 family protein [Pectobacterium actinidiae]|uniref:DUF5983 family protein n=1 Tax=Pectobacterium actinidiae TaxID=1507808 RepID=UPI00382EA9CA